MGRDKANGNIAESDKGDADKETRPESAESKKLIKQRAVCKYKVTMYNKFLATLPEEEPPSQAVMIELGLRTDRLLQLYSEFDSIQGRLEELNEDMDAQLCEREQFEDAYHHAIAQGKAILDSGSPSSTVIEPVTNFDHDAIRFPPIKLPHFSGDIMQWLDFRDSFDAVVNQSSLKPIQRFKYLKSYLSGSALEAVSSLEFTGENYIIAWETLCERFNNPRLLVFKHLRELFTTEPVPHTSAAIRKLLDNMSKHLRTLESLSVATKEWDLLIIFFMSSKLDKSLQNKWEETIDSKKLPSLQEFRTFLENRAGLLDTMSSREPVEPSDRRASSGKSLVITSSPKPVGNNRSFVCQVCGLSHFVNQCPKFLAMNTSARVNEVKRLRLCFNCLKTNHGLATCYATNCRTCKGKHHTLLHFDSNQESAPQSTMAVRDPVVIENKKEPVAGPSKETFNGMAAVNTCKRVILSTAIVHVLDRNNQPINLKVLLDSGSQSNFISQRAYDLLKLKKERINLEVCGLNDSSTKLEYLCNINLLSKDHSYSARLSCLIVPTICKLSSHVTNIEFNIPQHYDLADETYNQPSEVDLIVGAEVFYELLCAEQHKLGKGLPILQRTRLGWVVSGAVCAQPRPSRVNCHLSLNQKLQTFWELEECQNNLLTNDESECEDIFLGHKRTVDGKFVVDIPLKSQETLLGQSKAIAYNRFKALETKLSRDSNIKSMYVNFMREFEEAGHMIKIPDDDSLNHLPHHAVVNLNKTTTPLRVVIDASCSTTSGVSLNDIQHKGTIAQDDLMSILIRLRKHTYVVNADIEKMYRCIFINPNQRHLQCILWREEPFHRLNTYALTTLSFGLKSAPSVATRCLLQLSIESKIEFPEASEEIAKNFYYDDLIFGGDDADKVIKTALQIRDILQGAQFNLRKWKSNSTHVLDSICANTNQTNGAEQSQSLEFGTGQAQEGQTDKVLGLAWDSSTDTLTYKVKVEVLPEKITKRKVVSIIASIFDPLGLIGPVITTAKCFIQKLWADDSKWDDILSPSLQAEWRQFYENLHLLNSLTIPRCVTIKNNIVIDLHGFADSSAKAYGTALYLRSIDREGNILSRLLFAKSKVAPQKTQTIPRLELCAALLLALCCAKIKTALDGHINRIYLWSDSNIVLAWINTSLHKLNRFVSNRVSQIQSLTDTADWRWVSTNDNPADLISRGISADKLANLTLWFEGPEWLSKPVEQWPTNREPECNPLPEVEPILCNLNIKNNPLMDELFTKWSNYATLVRVFAFMLRFLHNLKHKTNRVTGPLAVKELTNSTNTLVKFAQMESFPKEYGLLSKGQTVMPNSKILDLKPIMKNELMCVAGRLGLSNFSDSKKYPLILHSEHVLTKLILTAEHLRLLHAGPQLLLSSVRERFWPVKGKYLATKVVQQCVTCFKAKPRDSVPIMGDLPASRVTPSPPFYTTGVDYAGPFLVRDRRGRGYKTNKGYIAIFVCFVTKAIHIELITGLETKAFLGAFRRFTSRRGIPKEMVSDNGSTFVGAKSELSDLYNYINLHASELFASCASQGITWKFIPVYSPHMGGIWEAAVKSCKYHLKRIVGQALLTYEEFSTLLTQVEGILNSRPLCPIPNSSLEVAPALTPAHFLIGRSISSLPDHDYTDTPSNRINHYQQLQQLHQNFWRSWSRDYIGQLQQRTKWQSSKGPALVEGAIVLVKDAQLHPCQWKLGRITATHPGQDGVVRVATLKTAKGTIKRSFNNICPLPIEVI